MIHEQWEQHVQPIYMEWWGGARRQKVPRFLAVPSATKMAINTLLSLLGRPSRSFLLETIGYTYIHIYIHTYIHYIHTYIYINIYLSMYLSMYLFMCLFILSCRVIGKLYSSEALAASIHPRVGVASASPSQFLPYVWMCLHAVLLIYICIYMYVYIYIIL